MIRSVQRIKFGFLFFLVVCVSSCAAPSEVLPERNSADEQDSGAESLLKHLALEIDTEVLRCLEPPLELLAQRMLTLPGNDQTDFSKLKESIYLRAELDLAATDFYYAQPSVCDKDRMWLEIDKIRMQNAEFLDSHLTVRFVESLERDFRTVGSIDVIARHYTRDLPNGGNAAEKLKSIYAELLPSGSVDPLSYAGIVDSISIRKSGMQVYGSYVACEGIRWRYDPPIADEENLDERRTSIMGDREWPDHPDDLCIQR